MVCSELKIYRCLEKVNQDDDVDNIFVQSQLFGLRFALGCVDISILWPDMRILDFRSFSCDRHNEGGRHLGAFLVQA